MRSRRFALPLFSLAAIGIAALLYSSVTSQTPRKNQNQNSNSSSPVEDVVKVDVDLVKIDALVMQKKTARVVGGLTKDDFLIYEDGTKQDISHFSKDSLPLSVILLIDRGGCLDPYNDDVHRAAREAIDRLKPIDEVAIMTYVMEANLAQPFTRNRILLEKALGDIEPHNGGSAHCFNNVFTDAANYMMRASNPAGRRVVIVVSGLTRLYACPVGPSNKAAAQAIYESGSVVCGIVPTGAAQRIENAIITMGTRLTRIAGADYIDVRTLAEETGGEVLSANKAELESTFQTLIEHLRSRYNLAFVSTNKKRDGTTRKLKLDLMPATHKSNGKLVIKARRSYVAPKS